MAITTAMCNSFKTELLGGVHDLDSDSIKLALIKSGMSGTYNASTTNYSNVTDNSDEASGTNYSAGGQALDGASIALSGSTAIVDFTDEVFSSVTVSAAGCIAVIDFGGTVSATAGNLSIEFPAADASNAVIRIA